MTRAITLPAFPEDADDATATDAAGTHATDAAPSTFELRRFLAGELAPERRAHIEALASQDVTFRARLDALAADQRADDAAFQVEVPLPRFLAEHEARTSAASGGGLFARLASLRFTVGAGAFAVAAAALFLVVRPGDEVSGALEAYGDDAALVYDGLKGGGARVGFLVREARGARFGKDGERLSAGDQIQFAVKDVVDDDPSAARAMVLVGIDGRGDVTVYAAERVDAARAKGPETLKPRLLPDSVVLDDATGAERFFVVYAALEGERDLAALQREVEAAARALASSHAQLESTARLPLPSSRAQSSVHIVKVPGG